MFGVIFAIHSLGVQQTLPVMLVIKDQLLAAAAMFTFAGLTVTLASGTVKTMKSLPDWLYYFTYVTQPRYAGAFLNEQIYSQYQEELPVLRDITRSCNKNAWSDGCVYVNGTHFLGERYYTGGARDDLNFYMNFGICFVFPLFAFLFNTIFYSLPLPALVKSKFRE
jgi:hypothetical protein